MSAPENEAGVYIPAPVDIGVPAGTPAGADARVPRRTETKQAGEYTVHPVAAIFPPMRDAEFEALVASMRENGQLEPIWTYHGQVIDGRHRLRACKQLGMIPYTREWDGVGSLTDFIVSVNLHRRHLKENQRAMIAARTLPFYEAEALARKKAGKVVVSDHGELVRYGRSSEFAGKGVQVSGRSVELARSVLNHGTQALIASVDQGAIAVKVAAKIAKLPPEEQARLLALPRSEIAAALQPAPKLVSQPIVQPELPPQSEQEDVIELTLSSGVTVRRTSGGMQMRISQHNGRAELLEALDDARFIYLLSRGGIHLVAS